MTFVNCNIKVSKVRKRKTREKEQCCFGVFCCYNISSHFQGKIAQTFLVCYGGTNGERACSARPLHFIVKEPRNTSASLQARSLALISSPLKSRLHEVVLRKF